MRRVLVFALMFAALAVPASAAVHKASAVDADPKGWVCMKIEPKGRACVPIRYRLSLEKPVGTPVKEIRRGERFRLVFWSPNLPEGRKVRYRLCVNRTQGEHCSQRSWTLVASKSLRLRE
jgi:hypothetical protein